MNEYTRSNAHTQILRTVKDFSRILGVELAIAEMACVSRNIRTAVPAAYGIPVQRSISERDGSYPEVELGLTGPTSISTNIRTTCSKSLAVFVSNDSPLSVRPRILNLIFL